MSVFSVDASVALAWCFEDEASNWTDGLLERLRRGDRIVVLLIGLSKSQTGFSWRSAGNESGLVSPRCF